MPKFSAFRRLFAAFFVVASCLTAQADFTGLSYEVVDSTDVGFTYRVYANFDVNTDILQALFAEAPNAMSITSSQGFYQNPNGGLTPEVIIPSLFNFFPLLANDSWITIGQENNSYIVPIQSAGGSGWTSAGISFEAGGDFFVLDGVGGSVFVTPDQAQGVPDSQGRVLIAQLTTTGDWDMLCNLQWRDSELNVYQEVGLTIGYEITDYAGLSYELVGEDTAEDGFDTYRVYANFMDNDAQLTAIFGLQDTVLSIATTGSFFQDTLFGGPTAEFINEGLFGNPAVPFVQYDSWITIGAANNSGSVDFIGIDFAPFEAGGDLVIDNNVGGTWYVLPDLEPTAFPDSLGRVLIGQFTTDGIVDLLVNLQYRSSDGSNKQAVGQSLTFPVVTPGCTDAGACNYNELADFDDGTCDFLSCAGCGEEAACNYNPQAVIVDNTLCDFPVNYPDNIVDCDGNCINDADGDEVCDENEVPGCTNASADNYNSLATDDDGSCVISGCTDTEAENFSADATLDDGSCQFLIVGTQGCTYDDATNYDSEADLDDGSCIFDCSGGGACAYDTDDNDLIGSADLLVFLSIYGQNCTEQ